jgi:hypothetical protein
VRAAFAVLAALVLAARAAPARADDAAMELAAVAVKTPWGTALASSDPPPDHYSERWEDGAWWIPGVSEATPLVRKVIRMAQGQAAKHGTPAKLRMRVVDERRVFLSEWSPFPGVYTLAAGGVQAWLPGVIQPDEKQRAALEAAVVAETGVTPPRPTPRPPAAADAPLGTGVLREKSAAGEAEALEEKELPTLDEADEETRDGGTAPSGRPSQRRSTP